MKKIVLYAVFMAILFGGIYFFISREPTVTLGEVKLKIENEFITLDGYEIQKVYKDKVKNYEEPVIEDLVENMQIINQPSEFLIPNGKVESDAEISEEDTSETDNIIKTESDVSVVFTGNYIGDILYTFYNSNGVIIAANEKQLEIPAGKVTEPLDSCIVQIDINWGKTKNYKHTRYFFKCNFT